MLGVLETLYSKVEQPIRTTWNSRISMKKNLASLSSKSYKMTSFLHGIRKKFQWICVFFKLSHMLTAKLNKYILWFWQRCSWRMCNIIRIPVILILCKNAPSETWAISVHTQQLHSHYLCCNGTLWQGMQMSSKK